MLHLYELADDEMTDTTDTRTVAQVLKPIIDEHGEDLEIWLLLPPPARWPGSEESRRLMVAPGGTPLVQPFWSSRRLLGRAPVADLKDLVVRDFRPGAEVPADEV